VRLTRIHAAIALSVTALVGWDQSVQAAPSEPFTISGSYLAGRAAAVGRDTADAARFFEQVLRRDPQNADLLDRTFRLVLASGDMPEALRLARKVITIDPNNRLARLALGIDAVRRGRFQQARTQLSQSQRNATPDVVATLVVAWTWQGSKQPQRGLAILDRLQGNELAELFRDLHAGLLAEASGRSREATRRLEAAYQLDQSSFVVVDAYARRMARANRRDDALKAYRLLESSAPRNARILQSIAALEQGRRPPPLAVNARQGVAEALFGFGQLANRGDTVEIAQAYLNLALYLEPRHELALLTLADLYENINQYKRAVEVYSRIPPKSIFADDVGIRIAVNLAQMKKNDEAEKRLAELVKRDPKDVDAIMALGNMYHRQKKYEQAANAFTMAVDLIKQPVAANWALYFARGVSYDAAKNWPRSQDDLKTAFKLDPNQPVLLNYLGYSWIDRGLNLDDALGMIRKAVELRPNDGDIVDSLGWAYYRLAKYDEAVSALERAVELKPQSWELNDHLGDAYWHVNRHLEARFQWLHALSLEPEADKRALIERKIRDGLEPVEKEINDKRAAEQNRVPEPADLKPEAKPDADATPKDSRTSNEKSEAGQRLIR
jgi:tetratricopeptide (TPR) repeat protein